MSPKTLRPHHPDFLMHPPAELPRSYFEKEGWVPVVAHIADREERAWVLQVTDAHLRRRDECFFVYLQRGDNGLLYRHVIGRAIEHIHDHRFFEDPPREISRDEGISQGLVQFTSLRDTPIEYLVGEQNGRKHHYGVLFREKENSGIYRRKGHYLLHDLSHPNTPRL